MEQDVNGVSRSNLSPRAAAHRHRPRACSETVSAMAFNSTAAQPLDRSERRARRECIPATAVTTMSNAPTPKPGSVYCNPEARIARFHKCVEEVYGIPLQVIENTASAGDVILMHSLLLHAGAPAAHQGTQPRFLLNHFFTILLDIHQPYW